MVYQMRLSAGGIDANSSGTLVNIDGSSLHLTRADFLVTSLRTWESPGSQVSYRLDWEIEVPSLNARLQVRTLLDDQELVTTRSTGIAYWEGAVEVTGAWREERVTGRGYVELTGYREDHRPDV
jgi:predicted secreted hydrolase